MISLFTEEENKNPKRRMEVRGYGTVRPVAEVEAVLVIFEEHVARETSLNERLSEKLKAELRASVHREYFVKHGEWDWIVRKRYMDLVRSLAHRWPFPETTRGYTFELHNYTPRFPLGIMDDNYNLATVDLMIPYRTDRLFFETLTEFVKPEHIDQCKLTPKITDAFLMLKYLAKSDNMKGRGFAISRSEESWKDEGDRDPDRNFGDFDYGGWKFHLVNYSDQSVKD